MSDFPAKDPLVDTARHLAVTGASAVLALAGPFGALVAAAIGGLDDALPTSFQRRMASWAQMTQERLAVLEANEAKRQEDMYNASIVQGAMAAARSASDEHLDYLANATARAALTEDERRNDSAMVLIRLAGDLTATHLRVLTILDDLSGALGARYEGWGQDDRGGYDLGEAVGIASPEFGSDEALLGAIIGDLERLGLNGDEPDLSTIRVIDGGSMARPPKPVRTTTTLGTTLVAFVSAGATRSNDGRDPMTTADWRAETLARMRDLIFEADPEVVEEVKWVKPTNPAGVPTWSHDGIICTGETYKATVKLTFAQGASVDDPAGLFNAGLGGNQRRAIDIHEGEEVDAEAFRELVRSAVAVNAARAAARSKSKAKRAP